MTAETAIHMMSANAPGWGPVDRVAMHVVHEFAHCVSLHVNPRMANNPRWYRESAAIYEARQQIDLRTAAAFGIPLADFERDWFAFVRERYSLG